MDWPLNILVLAHDTIGVIKMKINEIINEDGKDVTFQTLKGKFPGPFRINVGGRPRNWRSDPTDNAVYVTIKNTEPRGVPAKVMGGLLQHNMSYNGRIVGPAKKAGVIKMSTPIGINTKKYAKNWTVKSPVGLVFKFPEGTDPQAAQANMAAILQKEMQYFERQHQKDLAYKAKTPERKKEAAKYQQAEYKRQREELYTKYGKRNVLSVRAKKYEGDDAYSWAVFVNNHPVVTGISSSQVPYYKEQAYQSLLKRYGKT